MKGHFVQAVVLCSPEVFAFHSDRFVPTLATQLVRVQEFGSHRLGYWLVQVPEIKNNVKRHGLSSVAFQTLKQFCYTS